VLGQLMREYRKAQHVSLNELSALTSLSVRFLSEVERGKETAEIGKVLFALKTLGLELSLSTRGVNDRARQALKSREN